MHPGGLLGDLGDAPLDPPSSCFRLALQFLDLLQQYTDGREHVRLLLFEVGEAVCGVALVPVGARFRGGVAGVESGGDGENEVSEEKDGGGESAEDACGCGGDPVGTGWRLEGQAENPERCRGGQDDGPDGSFG